MGWGEERRVSPSEKLKTIKKILKEEDKGIVNVPRLLERLHDVINYKEG